MAKVKGYDIVDNHPENCCLKSYFYVEEDDLKKGKGKSGKAYQDLGFLKHKDYALYLLNVKKGEKILDAGRYF